MTWALALLIAFAANVDNLGVGIAYGIRKIKVSWQANLIIAVLSLAATWLAEELGFVIRDYLNVATANWVGALLIIGIGLWIIAEPLLASGSIGKRQKSVLPNVVIHRPEIADRDDSLTIDRGEAVILGIALSINAMAAGVDDGLKYGPTWVLPVMVGLLSFLTIEAGMFLGRRYMAEALGKQSAVVSGALLILIGAYQLLE